MMSAKSIKLVDDLFETQIQIGHVFYVKHPGKQGLIPKLRAILGILAGRFAAVKFAEIEKKYDRQAKDKDPNYTAIVRYVSNGDVEKAKKMAYEILATDRLDLKIDEFKNIKNVGRNDPCPCKSGMKFKRCHGK